jgi:hypothetical protein
MNEVREIKEIPKVVGEQVKCISNLFSVVETLTDRLSLIIASSENVEEPEKEKSSKYLSSLAQEINVNNGRLEYLMAKIDVLIGEIQL